MPSSGPCQIVSAGFGALAKMDAYQVEKLLLPPESILGVLLAAEWIRIVPTGTYLSTERA